MKHRLTILLTALLLLTAGARAQHYVGFSVSGAYPWQTDKLDFTTPAAGIGFLGGAVYQYQRANLLLQTGIEAGWYQRGLKITDQTVSVSMLDTEGAPFTYNGAVSNRRDRLQSIDLSIPLLVGGEWSHFYLLGGLKPRIAMAVKGKEKGQMMTSGDYPQFYSDLHSMPNHGFYDWQDITDQQTADIRFDLGVSLEAGYVFKGTSRVKTKVGLYGEFGVLNTNQKTGIGALTDSDVSQYMKIAMNYAPYSDEGVQSALHNVEVGVKATVLFNTVKEVRKTAKKQKPAVKKPAPKKPAAKPAPRPAQTRQPAPAKPAPAKPKPATQTAQQKPQPKPQPKPATTAKPATPAPAPTAQKREYKQTQRGEQFVLENLYFIYNKTQITPESVEALDALYNYLSHNPTVRVKIIGHTDGIGSDEANMRLSQGRAMAVKVAMMRRGIRGTRMEVEGRGKREPIATNQTPEGRQKNRRVVIEVL